MSENKQNDKPKTKTYTEQELNEELVRRLDEMKSKVVSYRITSNMDNGLGKIHYPKFTIEVSGGTHELLDELKNKIIKQLIKHYPNTELK